MREAQQERSSPKHSHCNLIGSNWILNELRGFWTDNVSPVLIIVRSMALVYLSSSLL